ncbi:MAG TPA: flagellar assembly protein FliW [Terriglobales bacterium]|nr:flagellar assembly protein FliW [Terriglobales bacterium]
MEISSSFFGKISFSSREVYFFSKGIYGFPEGKKYLLLKLKEYEPLIWLQSTEKPGLTIPLIDPAFFLPDYKVDLLENELEELKATTLKRLEFYVIVTLGPTLEKTQVNLLAPIVVNPAKRVGKQAVLKKSNYKIQYSILG